MTIDGKTLKGNLRLLTQEQEFQGDLDLKDSKTEILTSNHLLLNVKKRPIE